MTLRNIIKIDEEKCDGCGQCAKACAEGAIEIVNGKAKLVSDIYCDGLGACIGHCPQDAITVEKRDANQFDKDAAKAHLSQKQQLQGSICPGLKTAMFNKSDEPAHNDGETVTAASQLDHWPIQLKLVSPNAPYLANADLLLVADCVPFAMSNFHNKLLKNHSIVIGCPKLDDSQFYIEKLAEIILANNLSSLTVVHMEVPCCFGFKYIAQQAIAISKKKLSFEDVTIGLHGDITNIEMVSAQGNK
jgi:Pyruvate/2-oxoacid:ferredoxin oxidoreductase delta subunit